ncbi:MAG: hypothetical protein AB7V56_00340 [Candidatus Nitrosocosmicus sp.]
MTERSNRLTEKKFYKGLIPKSFDCGIQQLNNFIHTEVDKFHNERLGITYLFYLNSTDKLVGFVTISMADLKTKQLIFTDKKGVVIENYPSFQIDR